MNILTLHLAAVVGKLSQKPIAAILKINATCLTLSLRLQLKLT